MLLLVPTALHSQILSVLLFYPEITMILRRSFLLLHLFVLTIKTSIAQDIPPEGEAISLTKVPEYINGRPCLQHCIAKGYWDALAPPAALGCSRNSCLCRPDLSPIVYKALNQCMDWSCNNSLDKALASNIFKGYCNAYTTPPPSAEKSVAPATVIAETSAETKTTTARVTTTAQVITTQKAVTVTETIRAGSTTIVNYISSSSSSATNTQSEWTHLYVALLTVAAIAVWI